MKTRELDYYLPQELIAQQPSKVRSHSRLLVLNRTGAELIDSRFDKIADFLLPGDCLVLNDTKVIPARFFARRKSGGKLEGLFLDQNTPAQWNVYLKGARKVKPGETIYMLDREKNDFCQAVLLEKSIDGQCKLKVETNADPETILDTIGFAPLPP